MHRLVHDWLWEGWRVLEFAELTPRTLPLVYPVGQSSIIVAGGSDNRDQVTIDFTTLKATRTVHQDQKSFNLVC